MRDKLMRYLVGTTESKGLLERSGVRAFLGTLLALMAQAWADGTPILEALKAAEPTLTPMLLLALGLTASRSKKA